MYFCPDISETMQKEGSMRWVCAVAALAMICVVVRCGEDKSQGPDDGEKERELRVTLPGGATMEMVWVESGTFMMGTTEAQQDLLWSKGMWYGWFETEQPAHEVTITEGFYLGKYELTQGQWEAVMSTRPWDGRFRVLENPNNPAAYMSWYSVRDKNA